MLNRIELSVGKVQKRRKTIRFRKEICFYLCVNLFGNLAQSVKA